MVAYIPSPAEASGHLHAMVTAPNWSTLGTETDTDEYRRRLSSHSPRDGGLHVPTWWESELPEYPHGW
jgi:hypothetical protein